MLNMLLYEHVHTQQYPVTCHTCAVIQLQCAGTHTGVMSLQRLVDAEVNVNILFNIRVSPLIYMMDKSGWMAERGWES